MGKGKLKKISVGLALEASAKAVVFSKGLGAGLQATWTPIEIDLKNEIRSRSRDSYNRLDLSYFLDSGWNASVSPPSIVVSAAAKLGLHKRHIRKARFYFAGARVEDLGSFSAYYGNAEVKGSLGIGLGAGIYVEGGLSLKCLVYDDENDEVEFGMVASVKAAMILGEEFPDLAVEFFKLRVDFGGNLFIKSKVSMKKFKKIALSQNWIR
jgi:hypothetical protein